jgi:hypothetical protein
MGIFLPGYALTQNNSVTSIWRARRRRRGRRRGINKVYPPFFLVNVQHS